MSFITFDSSKSSRLVALTAIGLVLISTASFAQQSADVVTSPDGVTTVTTQMETPTADTTGKVVASELQPSPGDGANIPAAQMEKAMKEESKAQAMEAAAPAPAPAAPAPTIMRAPEPAPVPAAETTVVMKEKTMMAPSPAPAPEMAPEVNEPMPADISDVDNMPYVPSPILNAGTTMEERRELSLNSTPPAIRPGEVSLDLEPRDPNMMGNPVTVTQFKIPGATKEVPPHGIIATDE